MDSGGHGVNLNASWEAQEECLNHWIGFAFDSFGLSLVFFGWSHASRSHAAKLNNLLALLLVSYIIGIHNVMFWFEYNLWLAYS